MIGNVHLPNNSNNVNTYSKTPQLTIIPGFGLIVDLSSVVGKTQSYS